MWAPNSTGSQRRLLDDAEKILEARVGGASVWGFELSPGLVLGYFGIVEKKMETIIVYGGYRGH